MWTCAGVLALAACACAITRDQLYPHGPGLDLKLPRGAEIVSPEVTLKVPVVFYGETYDKIFVSYILFFSVFMKYIKTVYADGLPSTATLLKICPMVLHFYR